jgi:hypothetical protein
VDVVVDLMDPNSYQDVPSIIERIAPGLMDAIAAESSK